MDRLVEEIQSVLGNNEDFVQSRDYLADTSVILLGFSTLVDFTKTKMTLQKHSESFISQDRSSDDLWCAIGKLIEGDVKKAISSIYVGKLVIIIENTSRFIIMDPVSKILDRSIESPSNENVIQGPLNSFTENIDINIGIVRKQVNSNELHLKTYSTGHNVKKNFPCFI